MHKHNNLLDALLGLRGAFNICDALIAACPADDPAFEKKTVVKTLDIDFNGEMTDPLVYEKPKLQTKRQGYRSGYWSPKPVPACWKVTTEKSEVATGGSNLLNETTCRSMVRALAVKTHDHWISRKCNLEGDIGACEGE